MIIHMQVAGEDFTVEYVEDLSIVNQEISAPPFFTFDTETTGLHLKADKPTLGAICWHNNVYVFPMNIENCRVLVLLSRRVKRVYGHNVVFDMHMFANCVGRDDAPLAIKNFGDTMGLCRLAFEAVSSRDGGDRLGLKIVGKKYIDAESGQYEDDLKDWMKKKSAADNKILTAFLKPFKWSYTKLIGALKNDEDIPVEVLDIYEKWRQEYPRPTYADVPMEIMLPYVACDVILTQLIVYKTLPEIMATDMVSVMEREFKLLPVVYKMERAGIKVDRDYLQDAQKKLTDYIDQMYAKLYELTGVKFSVGQHQVIKKMYTDLLGEEPESTDKKFLKKMSEQGDEAAAIISRIRRFEKWNSTYITRILKVSEYDGRFYTSMNQFNPVSGRFSGDLQQMPKEAIYTEEGYAWERENKGHKVPSELVLYHPRKAFIPSGNELDRLVFADFSQVELRVQAHYTMAFGGDVNLCRAYMPFQCHHYLTGELYQFDTHDNRQRWDEKQPDGNSAWLMEDGSPWTATDVHSATTTKALVAMGYDPATMSEDDFKYWRAKGKQFNFMRNYGGGDAMAAQTLDIPFEAARAMNKGYTDSFPLVVTYQNAVSKRMRERGFCVNGLGRRYYVTDWNRHYKVANYLVQGSCADDLKEKMIRIDEFLIHSQCQSRLLLCVHDELIFELHQSESWIVPKIKELMEFTPNVLVPIVADVEYTDTSWDKKRKYVHE